MELYEIDTEFFNGIPLEYKLEVLEQSKREYEEKKKSLKKELVEQKKLDYDLLKRKFFIIRELKLMGYLNNQKEINLNNYNEEEANLELNEIISCLQFYFEQNESKKLNKILLMLPKTVIEKFPSNLKQMALDERKKILENGMNEVLLLLK